MPHLEISLLGPFQVRLAGTVIENFRTAKVQALLAYLAVELHHPQPRETLVGLLWPEQPEPAARLNLRQTLYRLRQVIPPAYLLTTRKTIQFNANRDYSLDAATFAGLIAACHSHAHANLSACQPCLARLQQAIALYRGDFLSNFYLAASPAFEEWTLLKRQWFHRQELLALSHLTTAYEQQRDYDLAQRYARWQVELDPLREEGHQQLMRVLALSGHRSQALAQYAACRRILAAELGVEPAQKTTALYQRIQAVESIRRRASRPPSQRSPFVGRERELAELEATLDAAWAGEGQIRFVIGGAGRGKTTLVQEFAQRAHTDDLELLVVSGYCKAHTGIGDPYLPFLEALAMLSGEVETKWADGLISQQHARRLLEVMPITLPAVVDCAPDLINTFIPGQALLDRALGFTPAEAPWLKALKAIISDESGANLEQKRIFAQYTAFLKAVARQHPLLLIVEDLHWVDVSSIALLFHLSQELGNSRIFIVGTYRPEEMALDWGDKQHPLFGIISELKRQHGDVWLDLGSQSPVEGRQFVDAYLDTQPNRLDETFRETLFWQTGGHALFTVELLREMQTRGDLIQDGDGQWVATPAIDWQTLPAKAEGVIEKRIERLEEGLHEALTVASVEGETFTVEVVARIRQVDKRGLIQQLSRELDKRHRLVREEGSRRLGSNGQHLSGYRFRHSLFQKYLYDSLDEAERVYLHKAVGNTLEELYREQTGEVAVELARHFEAAGLTEQAIDYLRQAGERARRLSAHEEAMTHFNNGLALLETLPDSAERAQQELTLLIALGNVLVMSRGFMAPEIGQTYIRAQTLFRQAASLDSAQAVEEMAQYYSVLLGLHNHYQMGGEIQTALELGEEFLALAQQRQNEMALRAAHGCLGVTLFHLGKLATAQDHLEQGFTLYKRQQYRSLPFATGVDLDVGYILFYGALALWMRGYPDQALDRSYQGLTIARTLNQPFTLGLALYNVALIHQFRREKQAALEQAQATITLATEHGFPLWLATAMIVKGWALVQQGEMQEGITRIRQGLDICRALGSVTGGESGMPQYLSVLAEAYGQANLVEEGLKVLAEVLAAVNNGGDPMWKAELYRLKGELLREAESRIRQDVSSPESCFLKAIEVARQQETKLLELRATVSLSRLWREQGKKEEARQLLAEIYGWFSEGFDTVDMKEAKALLDELSGD